MQHNYGIYITFIYVFSRNCSHNLPFSHSFSPSFSLDTQMVKGTRRVPFTLQAMSILKIQDQLRLPLHKSDGPFS